MGSLHEDIKRSIKRVKIVLIEKGIRKNCGKNFLNSNYESRQKMEDPLCFLLLTLKESQGNRDQS